VGVRVVRVLGLGVGAVMGALLAVGAHSQRVVHHPRGCWAHPIARVGSVDSDGIAQKNTMSIEMCNMHSTTAYKVPGLQNE